jgi:hypothetical protein
MDPVITAAIVGGIVGGLMGIVGSYVASRTLLIPYFVTREKEKLWEEMQILRDNEEMPYLSAMHDPLRARRFAREAFYNYINCFEDEIKLIKEDLKKRAHEDHELSEKIHSALTEYLESKESLQK